MPNEFAVCDVLGNLVFLQLAQSWPPGFFAQLLLRELFAEPSLRGLFAEPSLRWLFAEPSLPGLFRYSYAFHVVSPHLVLCWTWTAPLLWVPGRGYVNGQWAVEVLLACPYWQVHCLRVDVRTG